MNSPFFPQRHHDGAPTPPPRGGAPVSAPRDALPPGTVLGDAYRIERMLGQGGFGIVYLALDLALQRQVAIKEYLPVQLAGRGDGTGIGLREPGHKDAFLRGLQSFLREARLLAQFDHPSLVRVYRFWEANHTAYMAMPYYQGRTLKAARAAMQRPPEEAWLRDALLMPLLGALQTLHEAHCLHRDVSPGNILLCDDGRPVLLDFGSARRVVGDMTQPLTAIVNPQYAAIEQYAESPTLVQGPWTDLYGLGAVAYHALTGRAPVPATVRAVNEAAMPTMAEVAESIARSFPSLRYSPPLLAALDRALAVRPADRPQTAQELRDSLARSHVQPDVTLEGPGKSPAAEPAVPPLFDTASTDPLPTGEPLTLDADEENAMRALVSAALGDLDGWTPRRPEPQPMDPAMFPAMPDRDVPNLRAALSDFDDRPASGPAPGATGAGKVNLTVVPGGADPGRTTAPMGGRVEPTMEPVAPVHAATAAHPGAAPAAAAPAKRSEPVFETPVQPATTASRATPSTPERPSTPGAHDVHEAPEVWSTDLPLQQPPPRPVHPMPVQTVQVELPQEPPLAPRVDASRPRSTPQQPPRDPAHRLPVEGASGTAGLAAAAPVEPDRDTRADASVRTPGTEPTAPRTPETHPARATREPGEAREAVETGAAAPATPDLRLVVPAATSADAGAASASTSASTVRSADGGGTAAPTARERHEPSLDSGFAATMLDPDTALLEEPAEPAPRRTDTGTPRRSAWPWAAGLAAVAALGWAAWQWGGELGGAPASPDDRQIAMVPTPPVVAPPAARPAPSMPGTTAAPAATQGTSSSDGSGAPTAAPSTPPPGTNDAVTPPGGSTGTAPTSPAAAAAPSGTETATTAPTTPDTGSSTVAAAGATTSDAATADGTAGGETSGTTARPDVAPSTATPPRRATAAPDRRGTTPTPRETRETRRATSDGTTVARREGAGARVAGSGTSRSTGASDPRAACGSRQNFALLYCMRTQCRTAKFTAHPQCQRLRLNGDL